jgi:hypothetical protein
MDYSAVHEPRPGTIQDPCQLARSDPFIPGAQEQERHPATTDLSIRRNALAAQTAPRGVLVAAACTYEAPQERVRREIRIDRRCFARDLDRWVLGSDHVSIAGNVRMNTENILPTRPL